MLRRLGFMKALVIQLQIKKVKGFTYSEPLIYFPEFFNTCILWFGKNREISSAIIAGGRVAQIAETTLSDELAIKAAYAAEILNELRSSQRYYVRNLLLEQARSNVRESSLGWFVECSDGQRSFEALMVGTQPAYIRRESGPDIHSQVLLGWNERSQSIIVSRVPRDLDILEYARIPVSAELERLADSWLRAYESLQEVRREVDETMLLLDKSMRAEQQA